MNEQKNTETNQGLSNTDLAYERTILAHERTLMAWIRTAISMISFGFTIYKFFEELSSQNKVNERIFTPRIVGMVMICFGLVSLLFAQIEHRSEMKELRKSYSRTRRSLSGVLTYFILVFGLVLFLAALFRQ